MGMRVNLTEEFHVTVVFYRRDSTTATAVLFHCGGVVAAVLGDMVVLWRSSSSFGFFLPL
jgi:hypothetical protein